MLGYLRAEPRLTEAFRTGAGVGWHEHDEDVFVGCDAFYRPGYVAELVPNWIPALDGVEAKLTAGARVADVGCGLGSSSVLLGAGLPAQHGRRLGLPRRVDRAGPQKGRRGRASPTGSASRWPPRRPFTGTGFDLVTTFDCLHDMGDPVAAARRIREALAPDGTWLLVEPFAADTVEDNFNPVGRLYYAGSLFLCVPNALSQPGGYALGAQAGEAAIREVAAEAGFTRFRRAARSRVQPGLRDPSVRTGMTPPGRGVILWDARDGRRGGERFRLRMSIEGKRAEEDDDDLVNHAS